MNLKYILAILLFASILNKSKAQEITIFPGLFKEEFYVDDHLVTKQEVNQLIGNNKDANSLWKKAKTQSYISKGLAVVQIGLAYYGLAKIYNGNGNDKGALTPIYISIGVGLVGGIINISSLILRKRSILKYNQAFDSKSTSFITPSKSGVGLCLNF